MVGCFEIRTHGVECLLFRFTNDRSLNRSFSILCTDFTVLKPVDLSRVVVKKVISGLLSLFFRPTPIPIYSSGLQQNNSPKSQISSIIHREKLLV